MRKRLRRLAVVTVGVLMVPPGLGRLPAASACSCSALTAEQEVAAADVVFDGIATSRTDVSPSVVAWRFDTSNAVKGSAQDPQDVFTAAGGGTCGAAFRIRGAYRIFARREGGSLTTTACSNRLLVGYRLAAADGGVFAFGASTFHGSAGGLPLNAPIVGLASTPSGRGYWLAAADGGVFAYGDAGFLGSAGGSPLNARIVGITASPTGGGYRLVGADGGVFAYGDAGFFGSTGGLRLNAPVVGIAASGSGGGYWLLGADGGVFAYGDAAYAGRLTLGASRLDQPGTATTSTSPVVLRRATGITASHSGTGYWISQVINLPAGFGDTAPIDRLFATGVGFPVGIARTSATPALVTADARGSIFIYNEADFGTLDGVPLRAPIVAVSS